MNEATTVISFGERVHMRAGGVGRIRYLLLDRSRHQVQALVLQGGLGQADYVLPTASIPAEHTHDVTNPPQHAITVESLSSLPRDYSLDDIHAVLNDDPRALRNGPIEIEDCMLLQAGQYIYNADGPVGRLQRLILRRPSYELVALIARTGRFRQRCVRIPRQTVVGWAGDQIHTSLTQDTIEALPTYHADRTIRAAIERALHQEEAICRSDARMIAVEVSDGCVTLTGHLADGRNYARGEELARQVPGVRHVTNDLIIDAYLMHDVARALSQVDPDGREAAGFTIGHGTVMLFGEARGAHVRSAVEKAVAAVAEVRLVVNHIRTPDSTTRTIHQPQVRPRCGQKVFGKDGFIGQVKSIVMEPRSRHVTGIIIGTDYRAPCKSCGRLDDRPRYQHLSCVPVSAISSISPVEIFLTLSRTTVMETEIHISAYVAPPSEWRPPFPYRHNEVMFEARQRRTTSSTRDPLDDDARYIYRTLIEPQGEHVAHAGRTALGRPPPECSLP